jgi:hypothetical protein
MDRDTEQLNLLAIFHYLAAGLAALFSFFPLLYTAVGVTFIFAARHGTAKPGEELPPEFLGWIFAVLGLVLFVIGIAMAICIFIAGRSLGLRNRYSFALVIACIECLFVPFGTILGVFTIVALSRESVKALFSPQKRQARRSVRRAAAALRTRNVPSVDTYRSPRSMRPAAHAAGLNSVR